MTRIQKEAETVGETRTEVKAVAGKRHMLGLLRAGPEVEQQEFI